MEAFSTSPINIDAGTSILPSRVRFNDFGAVEERAICTTGRFAFGRGARNPRSGTFVSVSLRGLIGAVAAGRDTGRSGGGGRGAAGAPEGPSPAARTGRI